MANRAYLINTPILVTDPYAFREAVSADYVAIDGPGHRLAIPWLCMFRQADLKAVVVRLEDDDGKLSDITVRVPSTSVSEAIRNLERALPLFEAIAGDAPVARRYWEDALDFLRALPLPWLTLESLEILGMADLASGEADLVRALSGTRDAIPSLKDFSSWTEGAVPYSPDVLANVPGPYNDERRTENAVALDVNAGAGYWHRAAGNDDDDADFIVPPHAGRRDLGTVYEEIKALLATRVPDAWIYYGFAPGAVAGRQPLKMLLNAPSDKLRDVLLRDQRLRMILDGPIADELRDLCAPIGAAWNGFVFASEESLARAFGDDINEWVTLAPEAPYIN